MSSVQKASSSGRSMNSRAVGVFIGCMALIAITYGTMNIQSNYLIPICEQTGATLTEASVMFSAAAFASAIAGILAAAIIDKVPMKILMFVGVLLYGSFFAILYFAKSLPLIYVAGALYGCCQVFAGFTTCQPLVTWWHARHTAFKISMLSVSMKIFAMILSPLVVWLLATIGYHGTLLVNGGLLGLVAIICVFFLISNKPSSYGMDPYAEAAASKGEEDKATDNQASATDDNAVESEGLDVKDSFKTFPFWAIMVASFLICIPVAGFVTNAAVIYQSCGMDAVAAGNMISLYSFFAIFTVALYGIVSDRLSPRIANLISTGVAAVFLLVFVFCDGMVAAVSISIAFAVLSAFTGLIAAVTLGPIYGPKPIGTLVSLGLVACGLGSTAAPPVAASIYATTGSYNDFIIIGIVICIAVFVLIFSATSKRAMSHVDKYRK